MFTSILLEMELSQIILIVFIALLVIAYPILMHFKNKKETTRMQEQTNSLKRGDKVLTTSGVYGTIVDLHLDGDKKIVTIETGTEKNKGYMSFDAYAIYQTFPKETEVKEDTKVEEKKEEPEKEQVLTEEKMGIAGGEIKIEPEKKAPKKKKTSKKEKKD